MYKILIADDHPLFRDAIKNILAQRFPDSELFETEDFESTLAFVNERLDIDLILLDLNMPDLSGLSGLLDLRNLCPTTPVVIISAENQKQVILQTIAYGAVGFIAKSSGKNTIGEAIESIFDGNVYLPPDIIRSQSTTNEKKTLEILPEKMMLLTRRELMVLKDLTLGEANKQIAFNLNISETTVKSHVSSILKKLGASNRVKVIVGCTDIDFSHYLKR